MEMPRLRVSDRLKGMMAYRKMAGPVPRMLVLHSEYWLDTACVHAAQRLGWEIATARVTMEGGMSRELIEGLFHQLGAFRPDFVFCVNLAGMDVDGLLARLLEDLRIPSVTWFVDEPATMVMDRGCYATPYVIALTWDRAYAPYLRNVGFEEVHVLPLAVDQRVFDAAPARTWDLPPTFVGNSMVEASEREWAWVNQCPELVAALREAFDAGRVTRERFGQGLGAILGDAFASGLDEEQRRHARFLCFAEGTRRLRHALVQTLVPEGLSVRGDTGWRETVPDAGAWVEYRTELPDLYRRCPVNLNITSVQMPTAVNQRVFDCPAAGGFLLTDAQSSLDGLFETGSEVIVYRSWGECRQLLRDYAARPAARNEVVRKARARIFGEHTYSHRLRAIEALVRERFSS